MFLYVYVEVKDRLFACGLYYVQPVMCVERTGQEMVHGPRFFSEDNIPPTIFQYYEPTKPISLSLQDLHGLLDPSRNMFKYRSLVNNAPCRAPMIPFFPVLKKDLTFIHLGEFFKHQLAQIPYRSEVLGKLERAACPITIFFP